MVLYLSQLVVLAERRPSVLLLKHNNFDLINQRSKKQDSQKNLKPRKNNSHLPSKETAKRREAATTTTSSAQE
jgi:hypothetical protein